MRDHCRMVLALTFIASLATIVPTVQAGDDKPKSPKIELCSGYSSITIDKTIGKSMRLTATFDEKGGGEGTLIVDGNIRGLDLQGNLLGTTFMKPKVNKVTFEQQKDKKDIYEIKSHPFDVRLFLVTPQKGSTTYRFVIADKNASAQELYILEASPVAQAEENKKSNKFSLWSGYTVKNKSPYSLRITASLDDKGGGEGTFELDPNFKGFDLYGNVHKSTLLAFDQQKIVFQQVKDKPGLYEIKGGNSEGRLFLALPQKGSTNYRLVSADKDGKAQKVQLLELEPSK